jgi:purine-binding chemotaxis protein CheW
VRAGDELDMENRVQINSGLSLLCRVDTRLCALPLESVIETTRPLPVEPVVGTPDFVLGLSIIRGSAVPIVDAGRLLKGKGSSPTRFVMLRVGERRVGLAVDSVLGIRPLDSVALQELPPLIRSADAEIVSAIGALDAGLLLVLSAARIVPGELVASLEKAALAS